jgi:hypothetical protein
MENYPTTAEIDQDEFTRKAFYYPSEVWYHVKGGVSLHVADLLMRATDFIAVFRITWDKSTSKTLLAEFKNGPGEVLSWIEITDPIKISSIIGSMSPSIKIQVEKFLHITDGNN